jgi:hypothetical protein
MGNNNHITFKHSGHAGDIIYSLASIKHLCEKRNTKAILYIAINVPTTAKDHPMGSVMIPMKMFDFLHPLIAYQDYIEKCEPYAGQQVDYDLDVFRDKTVNLSAGNIALWYSNHYPELSPDLSKPWLKTWFKLQPPNEEDKKYTYMPILARTTRYLNPFTFPQNYINRGHFIGVDKEWQIINQLPHNLERIEVDNALHLSYCINNAPYVVSNQTLFFAIAEGLKVKRVLEQYFHAPNVIPQGGEWYTYTTNDQCKKLLLSLNL